MQVRSEIVNQAAKEFVDEMFSKTELNLKNALNAIAAKMMLHNKIGEFFPLIGDEQGLIDVDLFENIVKQEIDKLGSVVVPAIGTSYKLDAADIQNLFAKIRKLGE